MGTVNGYTAEHMDELSAANIVDGDVVGDDLILTTRGGTTIDAGSVRGSAGPIGPAGPTSIVVCTSTSRPTGGDLFEGLMIYETDTKLTYIYNGTAWVSTRKKLLYGFGKVVLSGDDFDISSSSGVDWYSAHPFDVSFTKLFGAAESSVLVHLDWTGYNDGTGWCAVTPGVRIGATDYWADFDNQNASNFHAESHADLIITGLDAGNITMRARMKKNSAGVDYKAGLGDWFKFLIEEYVI